MINQKMKAFLNGILELFGVRAVNLHWGPRGFLSTFKRIRAQGVVPEQIVDVGASDGSWSIECMKVFPDAWYFLVEPLNDHAECLQLLAEKFRRFTVWHGALGSTSEKLPLHCHGGQTSFLKSRDFPCEKEAVTIVERLDDLVKAGILNRPNLIKADVQGFEMEVLRGAQECLNTCELLYLEVSYRQIYDSGPLAHDIISYVTSKGFRIYDICTYSQRPRDFELAQSDVLFAKEFSKLFECEGWY